MHFESLRKNPSSTVCHYLGNFIFDKVPQYLFENGLIDVKYLCRYYVIYHNGKVPGESFLLLTSQTCRFIFYVELSSLWAVNNTNFLLVSVFIHQLWTANNAIFCFLLYFASARNSE